MTAPKRHAGKRKSRNQKERERKSDQKPGAKKDETRKTKRPKPKPAQTYPPNQSHIADQKYSKQERKTSHIGTLEISQAKRQSRQTRQKYNLHNPTFASPEGAQGWELLEAAGRRRGFLISGGEVDLERMSRVLLEEYRSCKLGRFTLERPEEIRP